MYWEDVKLFGGIALILVGALGGVGLLVSHDNDTASRRLANTCSYECSEDCYRSLSGSAFRCSEVCLPECREVVYVDVGRPSSAAPTVVVTQ